SERINPRSAIDRASPACVRIVAVDAATEHRDCGSRIEGAAVGCGVDSARETGDDNRAGGGQLAPEGERDGGAVGRARTRTDDRDTRAIEELERRGAAQEQAERRIVNLSQPRRKAGVASRDEAQARGGESRSVRRLVEARPEALEAERPR